MPHEEIREIRDIRWKKYLLGKCDAGKKREMDFVFAGIIKLVENYVAICCKRKKIYVVE